MGNTCIYCESEEVAIDGHTVCIQCAVSITENLGRSTHQKKRALRLYQQAQNEFFRNSCPETRRHMKDQQLKYMNAYIEHKTLHSLTKNIRQY